jgi:hypothetical protein
MMKQKLLFCLYILVLIELKVNCQNNVEKLKENEPKHGWSEINNLFEKRRILCILI